MNSISLSEAKARLTKILAEVGGHHRETAEARLFPLSQFMAEVFAAAMLSERAEWELREFGDDRKSLVAELYTQRYLAHPNAVRDIDAPVDPAIDRFGDLVAGAVVDVRAR